MAIVLVVALLCIQNTFANPSDYSGCDACISHGFNWCFEGNGLGEHCVGDDDDACPALSGKEDPEYKIEVNRPGQFISPVFAERTLSLSRPSGVDITYKSPQKLNVTIKGKYIDVSDKTSCRNSTQSCTVTIEATATEEYCKHTDEKFAKISVMIGDIPEKAEINYYIQCTCNCKRDVEIKSSFCNEKGNKTCGVCECEKGRGGPTCLRECYMRGDYMDKPNQEACTNDDGRICSGNGECDCNECKCDLSKEGSRYFNIMEGGLCADLCMRSEPCLDCGDDCGKCSQSQEIKQYNETEIIQDNKLSEFDRKWVKCEKYMDTGCNYSYYAMEEEEIRSVMVPPNNCQAENTAIVLIPSATNAASPFAQESRASDVPLIVGLVVAAALVAAVGGLLLWKHLHPSPQTESCTPLDGAFAEPCTGVNPLYKTPITFTKNPAYGKLL